MLEGICCALAALCLSKWAWEADYPNYTTETIGNGFHQTSFGLGVLGLAPPSCYRLLFPAILHPDRTEAPLEVQPYSETDWIKYHLLRFATLFAALSTLSVSIGLPATLISAALFGLTIRYDYWSNTVELLGVACVLAGGVLGWHWGVLLAIGLVLGTGRETLPFLALLGTPPAIALAVGAAVGHLIVRLLVDTEPHWRGTIDYATPMWRQNLDCIRGVFGPAYQWQVGIYFLVAGLAAFTAPWLTLALMAVTFLIARIDEPRVLTMLCPFSAMTVLRCL